MTNEAIDAECKKSFDYWNDILVDQQAVPIVVFGACQNFRKGQVISCWRQGLPPEALAGFAALLKDILDGTAGGETRAIYHRPKKKP